MKYQLDSPGAYQNRKPSIADNVLDGVSLLGAGLGKNVACNMVEGKQHVMSLVHVRWQSNLHLHIHSSSEIHHSPDDAWQVDSVG